MWFFLFSLFFSEQGREYTPCRKVICFFFLFLFASRRAIGNRPGRQAVCAPCATCGGESKRTYSSRREHILVSMCALCDVCDFCDMTLFAFFLRWHVGYYAQSIVGPCSGALRPSIVSLNTNKSSSSSYAQSGAVFAICGDDCSSRIFFPLFLFPLGDKPGTADTGDGLCSYAATTPYRGHQVSVTRMCSLTWMCSPTFSSSHTVVTRCLYKLN